MKIKLPPAGALSRQVLSFAFAFAVVFGIIAVMEQRFAAWQIYEGESADLQSTVGDITDNLVDQAHWTLSSYRQWDNSEPSSFLVITGTGQLVDVKGDPEDFIRTSIPVDKYIGRAPAFVKDDVGETWLIQNRRVKGGNVIGGIVDADLIGLDHPMALIATQLQKYGTTVQAAIDLNPTLVRNYVTGVMVARDSGGLTSSASGVPLRVQLTIPNQLLDGETHSLRINGSEYSLLARRITTVTPQALVLAFDNISNDAVDESLRFNILLAAVAWVVALLGYAVLAIRNNRRQAAFNSLLEISTRQLIAQGENAPVEFKSSLRRNMHTDKDDPRIELAVLKTIAAFLNTDGGILLIGVSDEGKICGIGADNFSSADKAMRHLTSLIRDRIDSSHITYIKMCVETMGDGLDVLRVDCKRAATPAYVKTEKGAMSFYVRTGPATEELPLSEVHTYIKTHFEDRR